MVAGQRESIGGGAAMRLSLFVCCCLFKFARFRKAPSVPINTEETRMIQSTTVCVPPISVPSSSWHPRRPFYWWSQCRDSAKVKFRRDHPGSIDFPFHLATYWFSFDSYWRASCCCLHSDPTLFGGTSPWLPWFRLWFLWRIGRRTRAFTSPHGILGTFRCSHISLEKFHSSEIAFRVQAFPLSFFGGSLGLVATARLQCRLR